MAPKKENAIINYFKDFKILSETRREYWSLQIINALDCTAYFAMYNIIVLCLQEDFALSEAASGYVFGVFASTVTLSLLFSGLITDWLGVKLAMYVGLFGLLITRVLVVVAAHISPELTMNLSWIGLGEKAGLNHILVTLGLFLMAPFMAMLQTCFQAANRRFTTKRSRGAGFNLWYLYMNVGAALGGFAVDLFYLELGLPRYHIFTLGVALGLICLLVNFFMIKNVEQMRTKEEEEELKTQQEEAPKEPEKRKNPIQLLAAVLKEPVFWRFTLLVSLLLGVRSVFVYLGVLHPQFWTRVIGPDAQIGVLQAFNPILVIIGLVLFIPILKRFNVYNMLVYGALITSISMFLIAIPPFGGLDVGTFTYITSVAFLLLLTVGELIWSPRLTEYTAAIAPEGQEGTYLGLSMMPYFGAKMIVSFGSGHMITRWCPSNVGVGLRKGTVSFWDSPYMMWVILGLVALVGTLIAIMMRGFFTKGVDFDPPKEDSEESSKAKEEKPDEAEEADEAKEEKPDEAEEAEKAKKEEPDEAGPIEKEETAITWAKLQEQARTAKETGKEPLDEAKSSMRWGLGSVLFMGFIVGPAAILQAMGVKNRIAEEHRFESVGLASKAYLWGIVGFVLWTAALMGFMGYLAIAPMLKTATLAEAELDKCKTHEKCKLKCGKQGKLQSQAKPLLRSTCQTRKKSGKKIEHGPAVWWYNPKATKVLGFYTEGKPCNKWVCWDKKGKTTSCKNFSIAKELDKRCYFTETGAFCPICSGTSSGGH